VNEIPTVAPRADTRRRLLDTALERFDRDGVLVTLEDLRRDAGVSVGAMYHHFANRRALATALYLEGLDGYWEGFLATIRDHPVASAGVREAVVMHLRWVQANAPMARFLDGARGLVDEAAVTDANRARFEAVFRWYRAHVAEGAVRDLPFELVYALWLGPAQELTRHWLAGRGKGADFGLAEEQLAAAAWRALKSDREER
jgi:AcrR family transcriptional regulator